MIQSVEIENFQSHISTVLDLHPRINLLIGESDHGKSAILRAIYWCAMNRPLGSNFINWSDEENISSVTIINDHHTINRSVGKGLNAYFLDDDENKLSGFGRSVPQIISDALKLNELNFQRQKDVFFLINKSAPEVGRYLNTVIDLDVIDSSLTHANKRVKNIEQEIDSAEKRIEIGKADLQRFKNLSNINEQLESFEQLENNLVSKQKRLTSLITITDQIEKQNIIVKQFKKTSDLKHKLNDLIEKDQQVLNLIDQTDELESLVDNIRKIKKQNKSNKKLVSHTDKINDLMTLRDLIAQKKSKRDDLLKLCNFIIKEEDRIAFYKESLNTHQTKFNKLMPNICPLCGRGS